MAPSHLDRAETAHGGLILTIVDMALGYPVALAQKPPHPGVTVSLGCDFIRPARAGQWIEIQECFSTVVAIDVVYEDARLASQLVRIFNARWRPRPGTSANQRRASMSTAGS